MVVIGITNTPYDPGLRSLTLASSEVDLVQETALKHNVPPHCMKDEDATVDKVASLLSDFSFVHFACHGHQDRHTPMDSVLYLGDGGLSLSRIASLRLEEAEFAFLSACRSASGSDVLPDEAMHIAAAMQVAGYRGVVAKMWSMLDWVGPEIVPEFYNRLLKVPDVDVSSGAAAALREAVISLRMRKGPDEKIPAIAWANFISIGV
jgi:CHAT domain-containing protein